MNNVLGRPFRKGGSFNRQRGGVAITVAVTLTGLIAMMGLAVDTGNVLSQRDHLQNMANAAALSAAKSYFFPNDNYQSPRADAIDTINHMGGSAEGLNIDIDVPSRLSDGSPDFSQRVNVSISREVSPVLLGIVGIGDTTVGAVASAGTAPEPAFALDPIMACADGFEPPGEPDTTNPQMYHFVEQFGSETSVPNAVGFRMFIDTTGFDNDALNIPLLYQAAAVMLGAGEKILIYEDTPTRIVDEFTVDLIRPGREMNTRIRNRLLAGRFPADSNSTYPDENGDRCLNCRNFWGIREKYTDEYTPIKNASGKILRFENGSETVLPSDHPFYFKDYINDLDGGCPPGGSCERGRRILKMAVAPTCGTDDLQNKAFACFFMLEHANLGIVNIGGIDLEERTDFIAQHVRCPAETATVRGNQNQDVVLYGVGEGGI